MVLIDKTFFSHKGYSFLTESVQNSYMCVQNYANYISRNGQNFFPKNDPNS